jgi:hypothetical protein
MEQQENDRPTVTWFQERRAVGVMKLPESTPGRAPPDNGAMNQLLREAD